MRPEGSKAIEQVSPDRRLPYLLEHTQTGRYADAVARATDMTLSELRLSDGDHSAVFSATPEDPDQKHSPAGIVCGEAVNLPLIPKASITPQVLRPAGIHRIP